MRSRAYDRLVLDIILGVLPSGEQLDEVALANLYGVGLAGIRDALSRLALESMVQRRRRSGTTVAPIDMNEIPLIFEAKMLIEPSLAGLAARHATAAAVDELKTALADTEQSLTKQDYSSAVIAGQQFYRVIARSSGNYHLAGMVMNLQNHAARLRMRSLARCNLPRHFVEVEHHKTVVEAIATHRPIEAEIAMKAAISSFSESVALSLSSPC
jgi:DNA-binding GntR family transcriptional regulator